MALYLFLSFVPNVFSASLLFIQAESKIFFKKLYENDEGITILSIVI